MHTTPSYVHGPSRCVIDTFCVEERVAAISQLTTHHQPKKVFLIPRRALEGLQLLLLRNETALVLCRQHNNEIVGQREPVAILPLPRATTTYNNPEGMAFNEDSSASGHDEPWIQW
jgi:hypothetical protein